MSKVQTIDALMESSIRCFSLHGYEGASLRDIAAQAGVPLSTIHMYFGSKPDLFIAVNRKVWAEIDRERSALLRMALAQRHGGPPLLEDVVHALTRPIVRRALSKCSEDVARIQIIRSNAQRATNLMGEVLEFEMKHSIARWIDGVSLSCPTLSRQDVIWAYSFIIGATYSWQLVDHRYDKLLGNDDGRTVDEVVADIVAFCCAGVQAMIDRRRSMGA